MTRPRWYSAAFSLTDLRSDKPTSCGTNWQGLTRTSHLLWSKLAGINPDKPLQTGRTLLGQTSFWETLNWRGIWYKPQTTTFYSWSQPVAYSKHNAGQWLYLGTGP